MNIPGNRRRYLPDLMQSTSTSLSASSLCSVSPDSEQESGIATKERIFSCTSWIRCDSVDAEEEAETSPDNRRRAEEPVQPEQQQQRSRERDGAHQQPTETTGELKLSLLVKPVKPFPPLCISLLSAWSCLSTPLAQNPLVLNKASALCMYTVRLFSVLVRKSGGRKKREVRCWSSSPGRRGTVGHNGKTAFGNQKTRASGRFPFSLWRLNEDAWNFDANASF